MRHIAIVGMSFCGSTVLSYVLGALPGVANVGETSWATSDRDDIWCHCCGQGKCPVWTPDFVAHLRGANGDWYARIGRRIGKDILVSSDKDVALLARHDPTLALDAVICFRPPAEAYISYVKGAVFDEGSGETTLPPEEYYAFWRWFYTQHNGMTNHGHRVWFDFQSFSIAPGPTLAKLCERLSLPPPWEQALRYWETRQHAIGGHFSPYDRAPSELIIRPRPSVEPPAPEGPEYLAALQLFRQMQRRAAVL